MAKGSKPNKRKTAAAKVNTDWPYLQAAFFCERLIELAAHDLGIDSAEMRRRNLIGAHEMPYSMPRIEPGGPAADTEADSGNYEETLDRCLAEFGWEGKRALQGPAGSLMVYQFCAASYQ